MGAYPREATVIPVPVTYQAPLVTSQDHRCDRIVWEGGVKLWESFGSPGRHSRRRGSWSGLRGN